MKRAFTLIELMVVVGIMAFLGVAATGAYSALQRGMAERSAVDAVITLLRAAKERSLVDRSPTAVFCYNRLIREATEDENAIAVGEAVAIRRAGRITLADGNYIVDEFLDAVGSYDIVEGTDITKRKGMKLWRFDDREMNDMQYSVVADALCAYQFDLRTYAYTEDQGALSTWFKKYESGGGGKVKHIAYAFYDLGGSTHAPSAWKPGNGYGFEFASVQLPHNFVFKGAIPQKIGQLSLSKAFYFDPDNMADDSVDVMACSFDASGSPKGDRKAGTAKSNKDGQNL